MRIKIHSMTPDPVTLCAKASFISHSQEKVTEIFSGESPKKPLEYLSRIVKMGHLSVLEHAYFNLLLEDAPVTAEIFLIRFRLASFTVKSRRYTDVSRDGFSEILKTPLKASFLKEIREFYGKMVEKGVPLEDARFILPYSFKTNLIVSINGRELGYLLASALLEPSLPEIRLMAQEILILLEEIFPLYRQNLEAFRKESLAHEAKLFPHAAFLPSKPVEILSSTANPDEVYSALACFSAYGNRYEAVQNPDEIYRQAPLTAHNRALEGILFTFYLRDISLAGLTHLLRHRMQSPILPDLFAPGMPYAVLVPPSVRQHGLEESFLSLIEKSRALEEETGNIYYRTVAALFPVVTSINARELFHFFKLRLCTRAQWEIQDLAKNMLTEVKKIAPKLMAHAGPSCVILGSCPEGSHSCGRIQEMKRIFSKSPEKSNG